MTGSRDGWEAVSYKERSRAELERELETGIRWEREQKDIWFWEKLGRIPFMLLDKLTPKAIRNKIGQAIDELGGYVQTGGRYLIYEKQVLDSLGPPARERGYARTALTSVRAAEQLPLAVMDLAADRLAESRKTLAAVQGATTGFGGLFITSEFNYKF